MPRCLTEEQTTQYRRDGYVFPIRVMDEERAESYRRQLEGFEAEQGAPVSGALRNKSHLLFLWVDEVMRHEAILDTVQDLIGEDILCWNTLFWIKEPQTDAYVSWHQDLNYWGLETDDLITVWLALSPATPESGCMSVLPGSHKGEFMPHDDMYRDNNMLTRGQEITVEVEESKTVAMALRPGEVSMHNGRLAHSSPPNTVGGRGDAPRRDTGHRPGPDRERYWTPCRT
jgi:chlorinating enzyme